MKDSKHLLRKLIAAGMSVFVALSCIAMTACTSTDDETGNTGNETVDSTDDTTSGGTDDTTSGGTGDTTSGETGDTTSGETDDTTSGETDDTTGGETDDTTGGESDDTTGGESDDETGDESGDVTSSALPEGSTIYLVGDSTVCSFNDNYYMPRYGYGTQIAEYFNVTSDQVVNLALSGRSSLSFISESNYTTLKESISEGDYLIIGFGHNDEKSDDPNRFTNPKKSYTDATTEGGISFQYVLYNYYIKLAEEAGATAILCTPIVRYSSTSDYTGAKVHVTDDGDYPAAIKTLGEETGTTVIDLTSLTKALYETDNDAAALFHAYTTYEVDGDSKTPAGRDDTHLNKYGAQMVAYQFATALDQTDSSLAQYVKADIEAPTDWTIAINEDYVKADYTTPDLDNETPLATIDGSNSATGEAYSTTWYKTVMGDIGGNNVSKYSIDYSDSIITVSNTANHGKFSSSADGFGAAFMRVSKDDNFTITVTAKITAYSEPTNQNQSGFGVMLRDDIYIDTYDTGINSNFVAAGILMDGSTIFSRENGTLTKGSNSITPTVGSSYTMTIQRVGQVVTVTVSDGTNTYTETYTDFDFTAVDNDYMYICLFANRGLTVEFSNITYTYDGVSQGA